MVSEELIERSYPIGMRFLRLLVGAASSLPEHGMQYRPFQTGHAVAAMRGTEHFRPSLRVNPQRNHPTRIIVILLWL